MLVLFLLYYIYIYIYIYRCPFAIMQSTLPLWCFEHSFPISLYTLWTAIVPGAVVTDNCLRINSCHGISRLYQATLMSCGTAKHVSVDCTIMLLHFGVVEHSVKLAWVSFRNNAKHTTTFNLDLICTVSSESAALIYFSVCCLQ